MIVCSCQVAWTHRPRHSCLIELGMWPNGCLGQMTGAVALSEQHINGDWRQRIVAGLVARMVETPITAFLKLCSWQTCTSYTPACVTLTANVHRDRHSAPSSTSGSLARAHASCPLSIPLHKFSLKALVLSNRSIAARLWPYLWQLETKNCGHIGGSCGWNYYSVGCRFGYQVAVLFTITTFLWLYMCVPVQPAKVSNTFVTARQPYNILFWHVLYTFFI